MFIANKPLFQFNFFGVPVKFGISAVFNLFFVFFSSFSPWGIPAALLSVTLLIFVHVWGHTFITRRLGYRVQGIQVQLAGGYCEHESCAYERDDVLIAWGGVIGQAVLLAIVVFLYFLLFDSVVVYSPFIQVFLQLFLYHNIFSIVYHLLPFPGFDGALAWRPLARRLRRHRADPTFTTPHRSERRVNKIIKFKKEKRQRRDGDISAEARDFADKIMDDIMKKQRGKKDDDKKG
jgi:hypothetical protein